MLQNNKTLSKDGEEMHSNWSEARKKAYLRKDRNPNSYYFRFNDPSQETKTGPWSEQEKETFLRRLKEIGPQQWGIFSRAIEGRVGYQCANYYRYLVSRGEIEDTRVSQAKQKKQKQIVAQKKPKLRWSGKKDQQEDRTVHEECIINGETYRCNDVVLLRCSNDQVRVGRIECMFSKKSGKKLFRCRWFYKYEDLVIEEERAEEDVNDREIFLSNSFSVRNLQDVLKKCFVYTHKEFLSLSPKEIQSLDGEHDSVFFCDKYFAGQVNFTDDNSEEEERETHSVQTKSTVLAHAQPIAFDPQHEAPMYAKRQQESASGPSTSTTKKAAKKSSAQDTIYCCIKGCNNVCWTKRLASNLKNHWELKEGGKYICGTHYNKDKKQKINPQPSNSGTSSRGNTEQGTSHQGAAKQNPKKRKIKEVQDGESQKKAKGVHQGSGPKSALSQVRGVVVYKERVQKENAIGEVIIFPSTTIEQMKQSICQELQMDQPFQMKRCHIPILESQYQKLAFLFFSDRVEDSLVIVPQSKESGLGGLQNAQSTQFMSSPHDNLFVLFKSAVEYQGN